MASRRRISYPHPARFLNPLSPMGYAIHKDMMLALAVSLALAAPSAAAASDDPPIHVWLNQENYFVRGDRAKVYVRAAADGYLVVLRADADGRLRVLFPIDPSTTPSCGLTRRSRCGAAATARRSRWASARDRAPGSRAGRRPRSRSAGSVGEVPGTP